MIPRLDAEAWQKMSEALNDCLAMSANDRRRYLESQFPADPRLIAEVEQLIAGIESEPRFLENAVTKVSAFLDGAWSIPKHLENEFKTIQEIGRGGSGPVYLARQIKLQRDVVLKLAKGDFSEAALIASLNHPNIVQVYAIYDSENRDEKLICLRYIPGRNLSQIISDLRVTGEALTGRSLLGALAKISTAGVASDCRQIADLDGPEVVLYLTRQICAALSYAHAQNVLHLDIKPANIIVNQSAEVFVIDFHVSARSVQGGNRAAVEIKGGTQNYMPPEIWKVFQAGSSESSVDQRADIFAVGKLMVFLLAECAAIDPADINSKELRQIADRAAAPAREDRYESIAALTSALEDFELKHRLDKIIAGSDVAGWMRGSSALITVGVISCLLNFAALHLIRHFPTLRGVDDEMYGGLVRMILTYSPGFYFAACASVFGYIQRLMQGQWRQAAFLFVSHVLLQMLPMTAVMIAAADSRANAFSILVAPFCLFGLVTYLLGSAVVTGVSASHLIHRAYPRYLRSRTQPRSGLIRDWRNLKIHWKFSMAWTMAAGMLAAFDLIILGARRLAWEGLPKTLPYFIFGIPITTLAGCIALTLLVHLRNRKFLDKFSQLFSQNS